MLITSSTGHQTNLFGTDLLQQLDPNDPLLRLASVLPWHELDQAFAKHYCQGLGRPAKPIRLMVGLLILKQLENLSDEAVVLQFKRNPYYQAFCGFSEFSCKLPCDSSELVHFRKRIGAEGIDKLFQLSVRLHGKAALEDTVNIDTTVQDQRRSRGLHQSIAGSRSLEFQPIFCADFDHQNDETKPTSAVLDQENAIY